MIVYQTNSQGVYIGPVEADESPLEPGVFLIPGGCVETPPPSIPEGMMAVWQAGAWLLLPLPVDEPEPTTETAPPDLSKANVNAERDRRILQGNTFVLSSGKQIALRGDDTTKENLQALAFAATLRIQQGAGSSITLFRDDTDYVHELTQAEVLELWTKAAAFVSAMFQAAWFLKDGPSIPQDYTDNKYWSAG